MVRGVCCSNYKSTQLLNPWLLPARKYPHMPGMTMRLTIYCVCALQVQVHKASSDTYAASIDSKIAMKVGWGNWSPNEDGVQLGQKDWLLLTSGPNFAVWQAIY